MNNRKINIVLPLILALVLALGMQIGIKYNEIANGKKPIYNIIENNGTKIDDIMSFINNRYLDTINESKIKEAAIHTIFDNLDPFSSYIPSRDLQQVNESLEGNFEGIGIEFFIVNDTIMVVTPISGGPSELLGIQSGDKIIKIDSQKVSGIEITNQDVVDKLRGPKGTKVTVSIKRNHKEDLLDYTITRDKIPLYSVDVSYMIDEVTGYLKINRFSSTTYSEFRQKMQELTEKGMEKLILDLRQNPGGYLNAATMIADDFLSGDKLIVYTQGLHANRNDFYAGKSKLFEEGALVVLIDEGSASASEIVSGAIQDWDRGTIVGRPSFGKGLVQEQHTLDDGSAIRLTVARYFTPSGRCIQKPFGQDEKGLNYHDNEAVTDTADSTNIFHTSQGKTVYGSGGITPDVIIPVDTQGTNQYLVSLLIKGIIPQFVYNHFNTNTDFYDQYKNIDQFKKEFSISQELFEDFINFAEAEGIKRDNEKIAEAKKIITTRLKAQIARRKWQEQGFYPIIHELDKTFQKGYKIIIPM